jgi:hypothetical protein
VSVTDDTNKIPVTAESVDQLPLLFSQLEPQQVEEFYQHYQHWRNQQRALALQEQIDVVEQHIINNTILMRNAQPSTIALATLTSLQSYGVEDVDLLDTLLERGEAWLDHTMQLLERCEQLDLIHNNYTEWCQLALEGAYDWLDSVNDSTSTSEHAQEADTQETLQNVTTEFQLLQKLMSEDETRQSSIAIPTKLSYAMKEQPVTTKAGKEESEQPIAIAIPTRLSYTQVASTPTIIEELDTQLEEQPPTPSDKHSKPSKRGLMSRIMDKVWQT